MSKHEENPQAKAMILYLDLAENIFDLPDASAGQLFKACFDFSLSGTVPEFSDLASKFVWRQIEASLIRNKEAYERRCRKSAGSAVLKNLYDLHNRMVSRGEDVLAIEKEILRVAEAYGITPNPKYVEEARKQEILTHAVGEDEPTAEEWTATTGEQPPRAIYSGKDGSEGKRFSFRNDEPEELPFG